MTCPHPPGQTRPRSGQTTGALLTIVLALLWPSAGQAAPQAATTPATSASQPKATTKAAKKAAKKKAAPVKAPKKGSKSGSKSRRATQTGAATGAAGAAAATPAETPDSGIRLPLMLRTTPSLPDNPAALQSRLDSLIAMQGPAGQGAQASAVRQLGPDIYAFSLHCADAAQCQRLRLVIEGERDWVAGLQLDERRTVPKPPGGHPSSVR